MFSTLLKIQFEEARRSCLDRHGNIINHAMIYIDEIDAIARSREMQDRGGESSPQTLNQLLTLMDGFEKEPYITVLASTNQHQLLDKALLRPGRFSLTLHIKPPLDVASRKEILDIKMKSVMSYLDPAFKANYEAFAMEFARQLPRGTTGADIEEIVTETYNVALDRWRATPGAPRLMGAQDFYQALEHILLGVPKTAVIYTAEEARRTALHEWGHALTTKATGEQVQAISVIPRTFHGGTALGVVLRQPGDHEHLPTRTDLENYMAVKLSGRAAERLHYGENGISMGAANDLQQMHEMVMDGITKTGLYPHLFSLSVFPDKERGYSGHISQTQMAKAEAAAHQIVSTLDQAVQAFLDAVGKDNFRQLAEVLEQERTINNPARFNALLESLGLDLEKLWQETAVPIIRKL